jgi:hypothetical protein
MAVPAGSRLGRMGRLRGKVMITAAVACVLCAGTVPAQTIRYHGAQINESDRLILEEENGWVRIGVLSRARDLQGPLKEPATYEWTTGGRKMEVKFLARAYSEVVLTAAPNYFQNPGVIYRIRVEGMELAPDYGSRLMVDAMRARATMAEEIEKLGSYAQGIEREALHLAASLVLEVFKESRRMPAPIMTSVLESRAGMFRVMSPTLERRAVRPGEVFAPELAIRRPRGAATLRVEEKDLPPERSLPHLRMMTIEGIKARAQPRTPASRFQPDRVVPLVGPEPES